jgi:hypothetical protein
MSELSIPLAATHFLAGSILSLVLPLGVLICVIAWYVVMWKHGSGER